MRTLAALVFPEFQTLDYFGPIEFFGALPGEFEIVVVAETPGYVTSRNGQRIAVDYTLDERDDYDMVLVPGGPGTPVENENPAIRRWLRQVSENAEIVMGVCTGSALLARSGLLDGRNATTNKNDFAWSMPFGPEVNWVGKARWVEDGKFFTSSGVSAGMDMSLAVIAKLIGLQQAQKIATHAEYSWHRDATVDPFAVQLGVQSTQ